MKQTITALLLLACQVPAGAIAVQANEVAARTWLQNHPSGAPSEEDHLAELKTANPDAYAIVKSLLMKRSLGLLDPKHPSASFSKTPAPESAPVEASASVAAPESAPVEASASVASESVDDVPSPAISATAASHAGANKNWLNWRPDSAANDEAMVKSVLGSVALIKGGQSASATRDASAPLELKEQSSDATPAMTVAEPPIVPVSQPTVVAHVANAATPVASSDGDISQPSVPLQPAAEQQNSYLAAVDFNAERPHEHPPPRKHSQVSDSTNYLTSFSWGDDDHQPHSVAAPQKPAPRTESTASSGAATPAPHKGALLAWLGSDSEQATMSKVAVSTQPPQSQNPYSAFLA